VPKSNHPTTKLENTFERWSKESLGRLNHGQRHTEWGKLIEALYMPEGDVDSRYFDSIGFPGQYPFVRGIHPTMYLGKAWTKRQYAGFGTAEETNQRYKYLLEQGQTGLSVAFDLPTQIGYDSDDPMSEGEVGMVGVAVDSLQDMEIIFDGIKLDKISTSMTINAPAAILLAMYIAVAEKQGIPPKVLRGTIQNDILKEYTARGTYIFPPKPSLRLISDIFAYCSKEIPMWNPINVGGYHLREAGCSAIQEIAFAFSNAIEYIETALNAGLDIDDFAPRISWIFNTHNKVFEEVAKYRAARKVWADLLRDRFNAQDPRSWMLRFHTQTSGVSLVAQQPENNIVRAAYQALAAVLGGAQSLAVCSFDEPFAIPTENSVRLSLRTQQILEHETGVTDTIDPLGGAYFVEALTKEMEEQIKELISRIDQMGGAVAAIEKGYIQREIQARANEHQREIEEKQRIVVGVNDYKDKEINEVSLFKSDPLVERNQIVRVQKIRDSRDQGNWKAALEPPIINAVKAYATIGEICKVLREIFGEYSPGETF